MKHLYTCAAAILLLVSCNSDKKTEENVTSDWEFYNLKGEVKSLILSSNEVINESLEPGAVKHENPAEHEFELQFNEDGQLVLEKKNKWDGMPHEQTSYLGHEHMIEQTQFANNEPMQKTVYDWDDTGKLNTQIARRNPDNTLINRNVLRYEKGLLAEKTTYGRQDTPTDKITYTYDKEGNLTGENFYLGKEDVQMKRLYRYDNGKKVEEKSYDKDDKIIYTTTYKYDGDNLLEKEVRNGSGELEYSESMTYDSKGNLLTKISSDNFEKVKNEESYQYDENGNKTTFSLTKNGEPALKVSYRYDDKNNLAETTVSDGAGNPIDSRKYSYEYDDKGNWIKKVVFINEKPQFIEKRTIVYY